MTTEFGPLEWVDEPPPSNRGNERLYAWTAEQLRQNPGQWAKVPASKNKSGMGTAIMSGKYKAFPPSEFEAVTRVDMNGPDRWTYIRCINPPPQPELNGITPLQHRRNPDRARAIDEALRNK